MVAIAALVVQSNQVSSICTTVSIITRFYLVVFRHVFKNIILHQAYQTHHFHIFQTKALGDTSLTLSTATNTATAALIAAQLNLIENKINGYATPSC